MSGREVGQTIPVGGEEVIVGDGDGVVGDSAGDEDEGNVVGVDSDGVDGLVGGSVPGGRSELEGGSEVVDSDGVVDLAEGVGPALFPAGGIVELDSKGSFKHLPSSGGYP